MMSHRGTRAKRAGKEAWESGISRTIRLVSIVMEWDCNTEMIAHEVLTNCTTLPDSGIKVNGVGLDFREGVISKKKDFDVVTETKQLLNAWYNEVKQNDIPVSLKWNPSYHNFCAIVRDDAKGMACTYTTACGGGTKMVCVYNAPYVMFPREWCVITGKGSGAELRH
ncbi:hypothetical protein Y032_0272g939 [Ancylostoma ceylanicum]|nr:hypothetical protein Y032_0272g939 [Ancylostoma ceylanicum]